ncbi:LacI family DNA-binding transcriptional regulator [Myceligenerans pegani]|uniref:LacI family DNA-binding transcriptional regulator n=1 Tax=Myceligenerans pegani TaxID=2776917 RepID=A0ABR9MT51_9MICO|nr:LacI family DNA-binding transcriptional regulator [Myceligenerans sp. TRM 65318]MBE1874134.1 LacI family DNA-binding transcriptional regulator [Myceligenerans sp. TRM 65318]MBE3016406.1 LacI family DNA-binding transcriptional regulator [Myceligenerans sp. TRM 65318]
MPRHRITQSDVAAMAGVSQATVSFVLNGNTPAGVRIGEETRQRVLDAIRITGYTANPLAQRLAGGLTQILGVFTYEATFPRAGRDFYGPFLVGIEHAAERLGVDLLLFTSAPATGGRRQLTRDGWQRLGVADGCLLLGQHEDRGELQHLLDTNYPFVFIGKRGSDGGRLPYVGADYVGATTRQVDRLVALGHRHLGYVGVRGTDQPTLDRVEGYRTALKARGLTPSFVESDDVATAAGEILARSLTAVVVAPENHPEELADELERRGARVPGDVSVLLLGQPHHPRRGGRRWSGFSVPREEMGVRALYLLSRLVADDGGRRDRETRRASAVPDAELHQLLNCPDVEGATAAPAPSSAGPDPASA